MYASRSLYFILFDEIIILHVEFPPKLYLPTNYTTKYLLCFFDLIRNQIFNDKYVQLIYR